MARILRRGTIYQCVRRGVPCMSFVFLTDEGIHRVWFEVVTGKELAAWQAVRRFATAASEPGANWREVLESEDGSITHTESNVEAVTWISQTVS